MKRGPRLSLYGQCLRHRTWLKYRPRPKHDPVPEQKGERLPVVEDISSDWNGPLPSFLSKSAG